LTQCATASSRWESSEGGPFDTIHMHIAADDGHDWVMGGTCIAVPEAEVSRPPPVPGASRQVEAAAAAETAPPPDWFLRFFRKHFGRYNRGGVYAVMEAAARVGKVTALPQYEFAAEKVVTGRLVLTGDAAHMASPRTASGAHTAVLDAAALYDAFISAASEGGRGKDLVLRALAAYAGPGRERAAALYRLSRERGASVSVPGWPYKEGS
jgi:2-polyprenyl-6-methoxyphenol hydroxylase-like FAD-dependent oxidoreductase